MLRPVVLRVLLQTESSNSVCNKPLNEVKNEKNKEDVVSKSKMDLKVPNHEPDSRNGTVVDGEIRELKAREEHKPKKVEGGYRGLLQISDTLANAHEVFLSGNDGPKTHNYRG
jgi:hypothetical protein